MARVRSGLPGGPTPSAAPRGRLGRTGRLLLQATAACWLAGCTLPARVPERDWLPGHSVGSVVDVDTARRALDAAAVRRAALEADWGRRERACYGRFFVNPCLADVRRERLAADDAIGEVEVAARERLRRAAAVERNAAEAQRIAEALEDARREAGERERAQAQRAEREAEAAARERERVEDEARRPQATAEREAQRRQREAEAASRRARAAERAAQAPASRSAYEARQERARRAQVERAEREARRRGRAQPQAPRIEPGPGGMAAPSAPAPAPAPATTPGAAPAR